MNVLRLNREYQTLGQREDNNREISCSKQTNRYSAQEEAQIRPADARAAQSELDASWARPAFAGRKALRRGHRRADWRIWRRRPNQVARFGRAANFARALSGGSNAGFSQSERRQRPFSKESALPPRERITHAIGCDEEGNVAVARRHRPSPSERRRRRVKPIVTMRAALSDPDFFGAILAGGSWASVAHTAHRRNGRSADRRRAHHLHGTHRAANGASTARRRVLGHHRTSRRQNTRNRRPGGLSRSDLSITMMCLAPGERASLPIMVRIDVAGFEGEAILGRNLHRRAGACEVGHECDRRHNQLVDSR